MKVMADLVSIQFKGQAGGPAAEKRANNAATGHSGWFPRSQVTSGGDCRGWHDFYIILIKNVQVKKTAATPKDCGGETRPKREGTDARSGLYLKERTNGLVRWLCPFSAAPGSGGERDRPGRHGGTGDDRTGNKAPTTDRQAAAGAVGPPADETRRIGNGAGSDR